MPSPTRPLVLTRVTARGRGLPSGRLTSAGYTRVAHGVYVDDCLDPAHPDTRIAVALARLPASATVGGWAAARLHEARARLGDDVVEVFDGRRGYDERPGPSPVLVLTPPEARVDQRPGTWVFRSRVGEDERVPVGPGAITTPLRTAFDLARLSSRGGAVAALDRLIGLGLVRADDLTELISQRRRWRGAGRARLALSLAESGVRSPRETQMRLEWLRAGLPRPLCNVVVEDRAGGFVAIPDLLDVATGLVGEYDGGEHAGAERRRTDARRRERLLEVGLTPVTMTAADTRTSARLEQWRAALLHQRAVASGRPRLWRLRPDPGPVRRRG